MNLVLDLGNTVAKLAVFENDAVVKKEVVSYEELQKKISEIFSAYPKIGNMILSNVSRAVVTLPADIQKKVQVRTFSEDLKLPFLNLYATPQTLGNDRKALVAAAAGKYPESNVLVIDAGTCITYDFKNSKNEYLGGGISPGLQMRYKALNTFTAKLPLVEPQEPPALIGNSTLSSINSGVAYGMLKEVDGFIDDYASQYENLHIIITGGDAHFLSVNLKNSIFANSNFLLEGLNYILEFNTSQ